MALGFLAAFFLGAACGVWLCVFAVKELNR